MSQEGPTRHPQGSEYLVRLPLLPRHAGAVVMTLRDKAIPITVAGLPKVPALCSQLVPVTRSRSPFPHRAIDSQLSHIRSEAPTHLRAVATASTRLGAMIGAPDTKSTRLSTAWFRRVTGLTPTAASLPHNHVGLIGEPAPVSHALLEFSTRHRRLPLPSKVGST